MKDPYVLAWSILLFSSIAWYALLVVYIGIKAGRELKTLIRELRESKAAMQDAEG